MTTEEQVPVTQPTEAADEKPTTRDSYSDAEVQKMIKERVDRLNKKYLDYEDLKVKATKLAELELATKTKEEQALARVAELEAKMAESTLIAAKAELLLKKRNAIDAAKLSLPAGVSVQDVLDMIPGDTDEAIEQSVAKIKLFFPEPKAQGRGTQTPNKPDTGELTDGEVRNQLLRELNDTKTSPRRKKEINTDLIRLGLKNIPKM